MKRRIIHIILLILSLVLCLGMCCVLLAMNSADKQTEQSTTEYTATILDVEQTHNKDGTYFQIYTKEYDNYLSIKIGDHLNLDAINTLYPGQKIKFRIDNLWKETINSPHSIDIVSLETNDDIILSLEDYNKWCSKSIFPSRFVGVLFVVALFFSSIYFVFAIRKNKKNAAGSAS